MTVAFWPLAVLFLLPIATTTAWLGIWIVLKRVPLVFFTLPLAGICASLAMARLLPDLSLGFLANFVTGTGGLAVQFVVTAMVDRFPALLRELGFRR